MPILAIETATRQLGVAVMDGDRPLASYELLGDYPHAVDLPGAVTRALKEAGLSLSGIEGIAVDIGPGSFTGLRIGLAFAKALAFPKKIRLTGVPSLDVLAAAVPFSPGLVCPILDAKQKNVYAALYRAQDGMPARASDYLLGPADEILQMVKEPAVFLGDGVAVWRERIQALCPEPRFAEPALWAPRATILGRLGAARFARGEIAPAERLVPLYLYPMDCSVRGPARPTSILPQPVVRA